MTIDTSLRAIYAITLTQPYASLMALGKKGRETRSWRAPKGYTGPIAIQAAQAFEQGYWYRCEKEPFRSALLCDPTLDPKKPIAPQLPLGKVLAFARLDGSEQVTTETHLPDEPEYTFGNYAVGRWMLLHFSQVHPVEPFAAEGALNFWPLAVPEHLRPLLSKLGDASALWGMERIPDIVVDDLVGSGRKGVCRLATTMPDIDQLHRISKLLALKREWFVDQSSLPYYPLHGAHKRALALLHGAEPVAPAELERQCSCTLSRGSVTNRTGLPPTFIQPPLF